jgi:rare lipoprotein A
VNPERPVLRWLVPAAAFAVVTGCATREPVLPPDAPPRPAEIRSPYGNGPFYEVHGRRYQVMESSSGYKERGVASWYGEKFHGKLTSSREPYDMYAMTAAHKTLPLPTWVRVRNLHNGKSVVVRVNDRGPFVANRVIDLSYAAALRLDIVQSGTGLVEITALGFDEAPAEGVLIASAAQPAPAAGSRLYLQVGAFGDQENARRRYSVLKDGGVGPAFVDEDATASPALYRVRIGPIADVGQYDSIVLRLQDLGIQDMHLVRE